MNARIDVVCPAYNRSTRLRATIDSVLAQTVRDWRLVVVSDGSTDDTDDVVRAYDDPRITLIRCARHGHPGGPRNIGIAEGSAPYVAYLDHDDRWLPHHLEHLLARFDVGARLVVTGSVRVDANGTELYRSGLFNQVWHPSLQLLRPMYEPSRVGHVRGLAEAVGGWTTNPVGLEDWDLWLRFADYGEVFSVVAEHTAILLQDPATRRGSMPVRHHMVLGAVPSAAAAEAVRETVLSPELQARLRAIFTEDTVSWYRSMHESGELVLPAGTTIDQLVGHLSVNVLGSDKLVLFGDLVHLERHGEHLLAVPISCASEAHAERLAQFRLEHDRRRNAIVLELIAQHRAAVATR